MRFFKNIKNNAKKWIFFIILCGFISKLPFFKFNKKNRKKINANFKDFLNEEKKEIKELASGKEGFKKFCCDSSSIFKEYFIPNEYNGHRPKILRAKSLAIIAVFLIIIKMSVAGYLFFIYPNQAKMSELITKNVLELINIDRKNNNIGELISNPILNKVALSKAQDMIKKNYFAHKSPDGRSSWDFIDRSEYHYLFVGENLAMNFSSAQTAHKALMLSETHKKNILSDKYSDIGLAVLTGVINGKKTNVLVQIFGYAKDAKLAMALVEDEPPVKDQLTEKLITVLPVDTIKQEVQETNSQVKVKQSAIVKKETKEVEKIVVQTPAEKIIAKVRAASALSVDSKFDDIDFSGMNAGLNNKVKSFNIEAEKEITVAESVIKISRYIFFIALIIIFISLLTNIFVKFSIQHKPLIIESVLAIFFIISLIYVKTNFLEYVMEKVFVA